jgi:glycosyltransferase involved in cell wall biosynthesis
MDPVASIVIPIHNEAKVLKANTERLREYLEEHLAGYEIILCENGSLDATAEIAERLAGRFECVECLNLPDRGLGEALRTGIGVARNEKVIYFPIDLSVDLGFIPESARLLEVFDVVLGSKRMGPGLDGRPLVRRLPSWAFHGMVRTLFGVDFSDTTCVKAYRRDAILSIMERVPSTSRVYETELLAEAERAGLYVAELPVSVEELRPSREVLWKKIKGKGEDLFSAGLDRVSFMVGVPMVLAGLLGVTLLAYVKVTRPSLGGFVNPYSFLIAILLVLWGFQFITIGLLSRLVL